MRKKIPLTHFSDMTPEFCDTVDSDNIYCETLEWAAAKSGAKNVAITGPFGSGKSSVIRKFLSIYKYHRAINVSLAAFPCDKVKSSNEIEREILQQLFYQVSSARLPYSQFKKIKNVTPAMILAGFFATVPAFISGILLTYPKVIRILSNNIKILFDYGFSRFIVISLSLIFMTLAFVDLYIIVFYLIKKIKLGKLTFKKAGFEFNAKDPDSGINKYLDEILYFFESTRYDVVVFEDVDRFSNAGVFVTLRQCNELLNNYERIKRKIVFFYAVKDELFVGKERTKFFDFIVPIIPFVDADNSFEVVLRKIRSAGINAEAISDNFIIDVSGYIDDMRMIINIVNEFIIYWNKLTGVDLNGEKLFAVMLYKNLCPEDFALLSSGGGLVYKAFSENRKNRQNRIKSLETEIDALKNNVKMEKENLLASLRFLNDAFLSELTIKTNSKIIRIRYNGQSFSREEFANARIDYNQISGEAKVEYLDKNGLTVKDGLLSIISDKDLRSYAYKYRAINGVFTKTKKSIKNMIDARYEDVRSIAKTLCCGGGAFDKSDFDSEYNKNLNAVIPFLLTRGYLDENYPFYISYFHKGSLLKDDANFIDQIKRRARPDYFYKLSNPDLVIDRLTNDDFCTHCVFNIQIVQALVKSAEKKRKEFYELCLNCISDGSCESKKFLAYFLRCSDAASKFICDLSASWKSCWKWLVYESDFSDVQIEAWFAEILDAVDIGVIEKFDDQDLLKEYAAARSDKINFSANARTKIEKLPRRRLC